MSQVWRNVPAQFAGLSVSITGVDWFTFCYVFSCVFSTTMIEQISNSMWDIRKASRHCVFYKENKKTIYFVYFVVCFFVNQFIEPHVVDKIWFLAKNLITFAAFMFTYTTMHHCQVGAQWCMFAKWFPTYLTKDLTILPFTAIDGLMHSLMSF